MLQSNQTKIHFTERVEENTHSPTYGAEHAANGEAAQLRRVFAEEATAAAAGATRPAHGADRKAAEAGHEAGGVRERRKQRFQGQRNLVQRQQDVHRDLEAGPDCSVGGGSVYFKGSARAVQGGYLVIWLYANVYMGLNGCTKTLSLLPSSFLNFL